MIAIEIAEREKQENEMPWARKKHIRACGVFRLVCSFFAFCFVEARLAIGSAFFFF
jgi:hypothetical protein